MHKHLTVFIPVSFEPNKNVTHYNFYLTFYYAPHSNSEMAHIPTDVVDWLVGHERVLPRNAWMDFDQIWWTDGPLGQGQLD